MKHLFNIFWRFCEFGLN